MVGWRLQVELKFPSSVYRIDVRGGGRKQNKWWRGRFLIRVGEVSDQLDGGPKLVCGTHIYTIVTTAGSRGCSEEERTNGREIGVDQKRVEASAGNKAINNNGMKKGGVVPPGAPKPRLATAVQPERTAPTIIPARTRNVLLPGFTNGDRAGCW